MKIHSSFMCCLLLFFLFHGCGEEESAKQSVHDPSKPVVLASYAPLEGGVRTKVLLDGENFGSDLSKIEVYFNNARASVVSSNGNRMYVIVPRLPGNDCVVKVVVGDDSQVYEKTFTYHTTSNVSTVTGNGTQAFKAGTLAESQVYSRYLVTDNEGNVFASFRDGGFYGVARINEQQNIVSPLIVNTSTTILNPNSVTMDPITQTIAVPTDGVREVYYTFDPREAWAPRLRSIKYTPGQLASIITGDHYKNFMSYCPHDGMLYTRYRDGTVTRINPTTLEPTIIYKTQVGTNYGQAFNPKKPWLLYFTFSNNITTEFKQGIVVLDIRDPAGTGGLKRLNAPGGGDHRDGPLANALFFEPRQLAFDEDGNLFVADYSNHCIRRISAEGIVETVAGIPKTAGVKDGGPMEALLKNPWGVAVNKDGVIYISDYGNARIRKLNIE